jgi:hypothetical protein
VFICIFLQISERLLLTSDEIDRRALRPGRLRRGVAEPEEREHRDADQEHGPPPRGDLGRHRRRSGRVGQGRNGSGHSPRADTAGEAGGRWSRRREEEVVVAHAGVVDAREREPYAPPRSPPPQVCSLETLPGLLTCAFGAAEMSRCVGERRRGGNGLCFWAGIFLYMAHH